MKKKLYVIAAGALAAAVVAYLVLGRGSKDGSSEFRLAPVERGDVEALVSATGTLSAVTTVQVGTQVSGRVDALMVDFNDTVKKGQLIARIDPTLQQQTVRDAEAGVERSQAELDQSQREYDRNKQLFDRKVLTEIDFNTAKYGLEVAKANLKSARVTLERARQNLAYTSIYAPIDGVVVERDVDVGQTVAASLSAPQLFLIANDLKHMQILASVDESDIGQIKDGQTVRFAVQAYPGQKFPGVVQQVRLQSKVQENVVNYTVVVSLENVGGKLLPGMTATVEFLTGSAHGVLLVQNAALRFRPSRDQLAALRAESSGNGERPAGATERPAAGGARPAGAQGAAWQGNGSGAGGRNATAVWILDDKDKLARIRVTAGITDGQRTQVESPKLKEGMQVIVGTTQGTATTGSSPFQSTEPQGGRRPPGAF
jgi:HlyD family secretion protein